MSGPWQPGWTFLGALALTALAGLVLWAMRRVLSSVGASDDHASAGALALGAFALADVPGGVAGDIAVGAVVVAVVCVVGGAVAAARKGPVTRAMTVPFAGVTGEVVVAVVVVVLSVCALSTFMWDERSTHLPLAGALARGVFPLEHPLFPDQPLRYHAGFAVIVAVVRRLTHLPLDVCADVVTITALAVLIPLIHRVVFELSQRTQEDGGAHEGVARRSAAIGVVVVLCSAGPLAAVLADGWGAPVPGRDLLPAAWVNGATFPPLVVTNVFQHPQGLAMPIALVGVRVLLLPTNVGRLVLLGAVVVILARVQVLFCAAVGLAMALRWAIDLPRHDRARAALGVVVIVAAGVVAVLGGRIVPAGVDGALRFGGGYFAADGALALVRELLAFGLSLLALPIALRIALRVHGRDRDAAVVVVILGVLGSVGFVVGNVAVYARSWDIVKFFGVSMFFGQLALAVWLGQLRARIHVALVVVSCWSGCFWMLRHGPLQGIVAPMVPERGIPAWVATFDDACGHLVPPRAHVWSSALDVALVGYLTPGVDWRRSRDTAALLIDRELADDKRQRRQRVLADVDAAAVEQQQQQQLDNADVVVFGPGTPRGQTRRWREACAAGGARLLVHNDDVGAIP